MENKETYLGYLSDSYNWFKTYRRYFNGFKRTMTSARSYNDRRVTAIGSLQSKVDQLTSEKNNNNNVKGGSIRNEYRGGYLDVLLEKIYTEGLVDKILVLVNEGEATQIDLDRAQLLLSKITEITEYINNDIHLLEDFISESDFSQEPLEDIRNFLYFKFQGNAQNIAALELEILKADRKLLVAADIWSVRQTELMDEIAAIDAIISQMDTGSPTYQADVAPYLSDKATINMAIDNYQKEYDKFVGELNAVKSNCIDKINIYNDDMNSGYVQNLISISGFDSSLNPELGIPEMREMLITGGKTGYMSASINNGTFNFDFELFGNSYSLNAGAKTSYLIQEVSGQNLNVPAQAIYENIRNYENGLNEDFTGVVNTYKPSIENAKKEIANLDSEISSLQELITNINTEIADGQSDYDWNLNDYNQMVTARDSYNTLTSSISDAETALAGLDPASTSYSEDSAALEAQLVQLNSDRDAVLSQYPGWTFEDLQLNIFYREKDIELYNLLNPVRLSRLSDVENKLSDLISNRDQYYIVLSDAESAMNSELDSIKQGLLDKMNIINNNTSWFLIGSALYQSKKSELFNKLETQLILD